MYNIAGQNVAIIEQKDTLFTYLAYEYTIDLQEI